MFILLKTTSKEANMRNNKNMEKYEAQQVKDPALSLLWFWSQLPCGFNLWPKNFCMLLMGGWGCVYIHIYIWVFFGFFLSFYGSTRGICSSQARGHIGAAAAGLHHSHRNLCCTLWQCWILVPLNKARDRTGFLKDTSWVLNPLSHNGNSKK